MGDSGSIYPLAAVRAVILHAQGLGAANGAEPAPTLDLLYDTVERIGCVQIDTLQMVQRSQYLALWSRVGAYDPADFDRLLFDPAQRRLFEGWLHAASIIPLPDYRYQLPGMRQAASSARTQAWLSKDGNTELMQGVRERLAGEGMLRAADFEQTGPRRGSWWDWKPAKVALEHLFAWGEVMIADRRSFQRAYDLRERVLPPWVERAEPTAVEADRHWVEKSVRALGACLPGQVAHYVYLKQAQTRPHLEALQAEGVVVSVSARLIDGQIASLVIHRDHLPLLAQAADGAWRPQRTTFLSPFDSLFWARGRDLQVWGYRKALEAYKPAAQRQWGYFSLPILHHDRLVGRFDPKLERRAGVLRLRALYLEPGVAPDEELVAGIAVAMKDFLTLHGARDLVIEKSEPAEVGEKVLAALA